MGGPATVAVRTKHQARPGRRAIVVTDLASLRGPDHGTVELPLRLFWSSADRGFDLDCPSTCRSCYQTVLREAARASDLVEYLNRSLLVRLWPDLRLPAGVRRAWEELHPVLRSRGSDMPGFASRSARTRHQRRRRRGKSCQMTGRIRRSFCHQSPRSPDCVNTRRAGATGSAARLAVSRSAITTGMRLSARDRVSSANWLRRTRLTLGRHRGG
jgi:hypothetical protein